jgi:hypothetical protein
MLFLLQPSDRLKSEEELAREEKEKLEKLEMERLQRMHGFKEDFVPERKHRSADDLDDGFVFNISTFVGLNSLCHHCSVIISHWTNLIHSTHTFSPGFP